MILGIVGCWLLGLLVVSSLFFVQLVGLCFLLLLFGGCCFDCCFGCWLGWLLAASLVDSWLVWFLFVGLVCCWSLVVCSFDWRIIGSWLDSLLVAGLVGCWLFAWLFGVCWLVFGLVG